MKKISTRRAIAAAGVVGAALMGLTSLGAGGAAAGPLPGGFVTKTLADGTPVSVRLFDESVSVQRAVSNIPTSREAWLSGKIRITVGGKATGGSVDAGYVVGCQVDLSGGISNSGGVTGGTDSTGDVTGNSSGTAGSTLSIGPGQAKYYPIINTTSGSNSSYTSYNVTSYSFTGHTGGVAYGQQKLGIDGCGGYAEAKARVQVTVTTDTVTSIVVLEGKPFSIG